MVQRNNLSIQFHNDPFFMPASKNADSDSDLQFTSLSLGLAMLICCVLGLMGNLLSIRIFSHPSMRSSVNVLLTGLSGVDLFMLLLVIPVFVLPCLNAYYVNPSVSRALPYITTYLYPFTLMAQSSSVWTFVAITAERFIAVCIPLKSISVCTIGNARKALLSIYISAFVYNLVRFSEYKLQKITFNEFALNKSQNESSAEYPSEMTAVVWLRYNYYYNWVYFICLYLITHFVVPFSILFIFNFLMIFSILKARAKRKYLSRKEKSEYKTTVMMCVVVLVFVLCNSLPMILNVLEAFYPNLFLDPDTLVIGFLLNDVCNLLVVVNSMINFVTYSVFSQKYRSLLKSIVHRSSNFMRFNSESRYASETATSLIDSRYDFGDNNNTTSIRFSRNQDRRMTFTCRNGATQSYSVYKANLQPQRSPAYSGFIEQS